MFYMAMEIIGKDFVGIFIKSIKIIAIISLSFYAIQYSTTGYNFLMDFCKYFTNLGSNPQIVADKPNFIIYTIQTKATYDFLFFRNSGPFWEPGFYVAFLKCHYFLICL